PEVKAKEGYQFDGWYEEGHKVETMPVTVEKNGTYLAKISKTVVPDPTPDPTPDPITYTVHFDFMGGSYNGNNQPEMNVSIKQNGTIENYPDSKLLSKTGYKFSGWYQEKEYQNIWDFGKNTVSGNMTLYANWEKVDGMGPVSPNDPTPNPPAVLKPIPVKQVALTASPVTGDTANYQIYLGMFGVLVSGGMIVLIKYRRRKRCQQ
ncbi:MAG: InlB B-repeat-containing protein, partial [Lachnospiraceae bacterium]